jgi:hypothetical protein
MRTTLFTFLLTFLIGNIYGQREKLIYKTIADKFETNYNNINYDSIFVMLSSEMQNYLPIEKTKDYITSTRKQLGEIIRKEFRKYDNTSAIYKGYFEKGLFDISISVDENSKINSLSIRPYEPDDLLKLERNKTLLSLPFKGEWTVVWGGDTKEMNYHVESKAQKNAFDILITDTKGNSFKTNGNTNEDYYAFGKELFAPCAGEIVLVVDGIKDNIVNEMNSFNVGGNTIILKTTNGEFLVFCHLKHKSIKVIEGQKVSQRQLIGLCGNSGHSSEPHLHFHIQNTEDMNYATGVKCYFDKLIVNGQIKLDYSPIKDDKIKSE